MEKLVYDATTQNHRTLMGQIHFCFGGRISSVEIACSRTRETFFFFFLKELQ